MGHSEASVFEGAAAQEAAEAIRVWGDTSAAPRLDAAGAHEGEQAGAGEDIYHRIGHLTRTLHDALRELGYDRELMNARDNLPDARDRLAYIARVTGEAAEKVLNSVDRARTVQEEITQQAESLRSRWQAVAVYTRNGSKNDVQNGAGGRATPAGEHLIDETCAFFASVGGQADRTNSILTDIMMAQDFHDLTGQVIRKVVVLAQTLEEQLVKLLIEATPPEQRKKVEPAMLEGPVVDAAGRDDVVADQKGVDDLLAQLGF
jgi:chemotaxis protein CheZ